VIMLNNQPRPIKVLVFELTPSNGLKIFILVRNCK
jgi:hypothetical protein